MARQANATRACSSPAWAGRLVCCHAPRGAMCCSSARTLYQDVEPEIGVLGGMLGAFQDVWRNVGLREVGYRIAARFEEQEDVLAIGDPDSPEAHAHAPAQRLDVQQSLGQRFGHEKPADCSR